MTAIEELFRQKLKVALTEEKRRIAATLIGELAGDPKQNKQQQISDLQKKIQLKQSKGGGTPESAKALAIMKDKLTLLKAELGSMK